METFEFETWLPVGEWRDVEIYVTYEFNGTDNPKVTSVIRADGRHVSQDQLCRIVDMVAERCDADWVARLDDKQAGE